MSNDIPCTPGCPDRTVEPNCHSTCQRYIIWAEQKQKEKQAIKQYKIINGMHEKSFTNKQLKAKHKTQSPKKWR